MQAPQGEQQTGAVLDTSERGRWMRREWELQDESECLAENGVCTMKALEIMTEQDRKEFRCSLELRELLQHLAEEKKKRASDGSKVHKVHYLDETRAIG